MENGQSVKVTVRPMDSASKGLDAQKIAALGKTIEGLGDTINRSTGEYIRQVGNFDAFQSFQPINDAVLKYANSGEFRVALRSSLESMRLQLKGVSDIPFESAAKMLRSLASAADEIAKMPEDENGNVDVSSYADTIEAAEEAVQPCMGEKHKQSVSILKKAKWLGKKALVVSSIIGQLINPWAMLFHVGWDIHTYNQNSIITERQVEALENVAKSLEGKANGNYEINIYNQVNILIETLESSDAAKESE